MKHVILDKNREEVEVELTPLRAIRLNCIDCSGWSRNEVKLCVIPHCPLYPFRFGKNPNLKKKMYSDDERRVVAERLAKFRKR